MTLRHPSEGIAFEPLSAVAALVGGLVVAAVLTYALHLAFRTTPPKEKA